MSPYVYQSSDNNYDEDDDDEMPALIDVSYEENDDNHQIVNTSFWININDEMNWNDMYNEVDNNHSPNPAEEIYDDEEQNNYIYNDEIYNLFGRIIPESESHQSRNDEMEISELIDDQNYVFSQ